MMKKVEVMNTSALDVLREALRLLFAAPEISGFFADTSMQYVRLL